MSNFTDFPSAEGLICYVKRVDFEGIGDGKSTYRCEIMPDGEHDSSDIAMMYDINLDETFVDAHYSEIEAGEASMWIPGGEKVSSNEGSYIRYPSNATLSIVKSPSSNLPSMEGPVLESKTEGIKQVLVISVSALDGTCDISHDQLIGRVFGIGNEEDISVVSQISDCSFRKLRLEPAIGQNIKDGVGEINITLSVNNTEVTELENTLTMETIAKFGPIVKNFDHVIYCIPYGTSRKNFDKEWMGYSYLNSWRSYHNDRFMTTSSIIHELGHNWNFHHSGDVSTEYGDTTGYMGMSSYEISGPQKCFNGNKNWILGWYKDKSIEIDFSTRQANNNDPMPWSGHIYAFTDYAEVKEGSAVVIKVGEYYLQYNRAKSFNIGTEEYPDQVTVVHNPGDSTFPSKLIASLSTVPGSGDRIVTIESNWMDTNAFLVIEACQVVDGPADAMELSIHLQGIHQSMCSSHPVGSSTLMILVTSTILCVLLMVFSTITYHLLTFILSGKQRWKKKTMLPSYSSEEKTWRRKKYKCKIHIITS